MANSAALAGDELDVRQVPKPQRHPKIFERFEALPPGASFVLVNSHDPKHLRQEFERDHPGAYGWEYLESSAGVCRVQISKLTTADLPRVVGNTQTVARGAQPADATGAVWKLEMSQRGLDANMIRLAPGGTIEAHTGPDLDVLLHVVDGGGRLTTETGEVTLVAGALAWLPRRSRRSIQAGPDGLAYLTVHPRRPALNISTERR